MTQLTIDGETFRVEIEGEATKPALVLSNALGTDLSLWDAQMPALTRHFRVVRYDSRGHGDSAVGKAPYALARLGRDVIGILDALEIERAHIVGISMGGAVAQWLMIHAPERVERAVLANTAAKIGNAEAWNGRIGAVMDGGMDAIAPDMMDRWFSAGFAEDAPEKVAAVDKVFRASSPEGYVASCAALRDMDLRHAVGGIRHPVLVVRGKDDPVASDDDAGHLVEAIAGAKLVALDARHMSPIEAERAFADAVVKFLTAKGSAKARIPALPRAPRKAAGPVRRQAKRSLVSARSPVAKVGGKVGGKVGTKTAAKPAAKAVSKAPAKAPGKAAKPAARLKTAAKPEAAAPGRRSAAAKAATRKAPARTSAATRTAAKKAAPIKARARTGAVKAATKTAARKTSTAKSPTRTSATKTPASKTSAKTNAAKARAAKPAAKKSATKVAPARRSASSVASRATPARKKAAAKDTGKNTGKATSKTATKKAIAKKPAAKRTAKLPTPRRKAAAAPRRVAGRRKP